MVDKSVWAFPESIDKSVGTQFKSVRTQYNPLDLADTNDEIVEKSLTPILKVKIATPKNREKCTNTDLTFPPFANITFRNEREIAPDQLCNDQTESEIEDFEIDAGKETDPLYEPFNSDFETDDDVNHDDISPTDNTFLKQIQRH